MSIYRLNRAVYPKVNYLTLFLVFIFSSCVSEDFYFEDQNATADDVIRVRASVTPSEQTRTFYGSSDASEEVSSGIWYFTYPKAGNQSFSNALYGTAIVDFDASVEDPTIGFAKYLNSNGEEKDLKWKHVWDNGSSSSNYYYFYLHNINPEFYEETYTDETSPTRTQTYQKISFKDSSPFKSIRPLDKINGSNDIITGVVSFWSSSKTKDFVFELNHRLALFKFVVEVYGAKSDDHTVDLSRATITMNNLYTGLNSFSISSPSTFGTPSNSSDNHRYGNYTTRGQFTIKGVSDDDPQWESFERIDDYEYDGETYRKDIYYSCEFVVPPQTISTTPKFTVTVPKEDVTGSSSDEGEFVEYTGYLPSSMFNYTNGVMNPAPIATAFTGGCQLTVTASINSPETELHFSPVKVESWLTKGTYTLSTNQAGIYNLDDFQNMVRSYRDHNLDELEKYGYQTADGTYIIQFWNNVELPHTLLFDLATAADDLPLEGCMKIDNPIDFAFIFNGSIIKLLDAEGEITAELENSSGQLELKRIVSGINEEYTGITSAEDFKEVIEICEEEVNPDIHKLLKYGLLSNSDNLFILEINKTVDINIEDIFGKLPNSFGGYEVIFAFNNNSDLNIVFSQENNVKLTVNSNSDPYLLTKIVFPVANVGIYNRDDFVVLAKLYNEYSRYYPDILTIFGTENTESGEWTFNLNAYITIDGQDFYGSMQPDPLNGKPEFTMSGYDNSGRKNYSFTVNDEYTPSNTGTSSYYLSMIKANGGAHSVSSLNTIVDSYYNNSQYNNKDYTYLWYYGRFDRESKKWIFPLYYSTSTHYATWNTIFGKMVPDESDGKFDYEFELTDIPSDFEVRSAPVTQGSSTTETKKLTSDSNGAETLRHICLGDYWEWLESQNTGE